MYNFELLAPAGTYDAFLAAIENGANAIYLGGKLFNARANASNFSIEELKNMVEYAHLRNVKIHVTMNTLLSDTELKDALDFAYDLYHIGIDAVIVQDLGLAKVLHDNIPNLPLHASTQMSIYNLTGVEELKKIGFSRVVLARELSLNEIKYICENTDMEIEIFVHGALCVCYSGQCLMSSMIGDRSGNRGKCAQPCRMPYTLIKNDLNKNSVSAEENCGTGYLLSPKDLCTIDYLLELPNVTSLKIEGRMKSPEYVATVVSSYRKMLDSINEASNYTNYKVFSNDFKYKMAQVFNRGGFTDGYHHIKQGKDMMCYEKPKHWGIYIGKVASYDGKRLITLDTKPNIKIGDGIEIWNGENESPSVIVSELTNGKIGRIFGNIHIGDKVYKTFDKESMQKAKESYSRGFVRKNPVDVSIKINLDSPIIVSIENFTYESNVMPERPQKRPITKEQIEEQFRKTGNTPFEINNLYIEMADEIFLPISKINELRRNAFKQYEEFFLQSMKRKRILKVPLMARKKVASVSLPKSVSLKVTQLTEDLHLIAPKVDYIYVPLKEVLRSEDIFSKLECKKYILLPTITKNKYDKLIQKNVERLESICDGFVLSSICQLKYFEKTFLKSGDNSNNTKPLELIANDTFNVFNSYTIDVLKDLGFSRVILSPELTIQQINAIDSCLPTELMVYGNQCVMTSEYCPVGSVIGKFSKNNKCSMPCIKNNSFYLKDRLGMQFRVIPDNIDCQSNIYNCKITSIESKSIDISSIGISVIDENIKEISNIIDVHLAGNKLSGDVYTNGHANRPV